MRTATSLAALLTALAVAVGSGPAAAAPASGPDAGPVTEAPDRGQRVPDGDLGGTTLLRSQGYVGEDGEWHYQLWADSGETSRAVTTDPWLQPYAAALSPDGRRVAFTVGNGSSRRASGLYVVAIDGSGTRDVLAGKDRFTAVRSPSWSPDGSRLVFVGLDHAMDYDLWVVRTDGTALRRVTSCGCAWTNSPRWSPAGDQVLWSPNTYDLAVLDLASGASRTLYDNAPSGAMNVSAYAWSPDGRTVAFSAAPWDRAALGIYTVPAAGGPVTTLAEVAGTSFDTPVYSPTGDRIAVTGHPVETTPDGDDTYDDDLYLLDATTPTTGTWVVRPRPLQDEVLGWGDACASGCRPGGRWSQLSVRATTMSRSVHVGGGLMPGLADQPVQVSIARKSGRRWRTIQTRTVATSAEALYFAEVRRAAGQLCRVSVTWRGDARHDVARTRTRPFGC